MLKESKYYCPECDDGLDHPQSYSRRSFMRTAVGGAAALAAGGVLSTRLLAAEDAQRSPKPAEELIRELRSTFSEEQKKELVLPYDQAREDGVPLRLCTFNRAVNDKRIGDVYTKPQQDLVKQAFRAILSGDEAFERVSREGKWDSSGSFEGCGAILFGDPAGGEKYSWVFSGHHLTTRCDGNSEPGAAFGGPLYYGHSANGYADTNVYLYQTHQVHAVFDALNEEQRKKALAPQNPGDGEGAIRLREDGSARPGVAYAELSADQQKLVENVMRVLIDPFRKEDADEVMQLIKANGGMEKVHLAFYRDGEIGERQRWDVWRLEGPGFVWNFRVLPHVHCFVKIVAV
jgi:hypothetical protein